MNALFRRSLFIPCEIQIVCVFRLLKMVFVTDGLSEPIRREHVGINGGM